LKEVSLAVIVVSSLFSNSCNPVSYIFWRASVLIVWTRIFGTSTWRGAVQVAKTTEKYSISKVQDPKWVFMVCGSAVSCHYPRTCVTLFRYPWNSSPCTTNLLHTWRGVMFFSSIWNTNYRNKFNGCWSFDCLWDGTVCHLVCVCVYICMHTQELNQQQNC